MRKAKDGADTVEEGRGVGPVVPSRNMSRWRRAKGGRQGKRWSGRRSKRSGVG